MAGIVKFALHAHGNILHGQDGVYYDGPPLKKIRVKTDAGYVELVQKIRSVIGVDQVEVFHRQPKVFNTAAPPKYSLMPITDDEDVEDLIEFAKAAGIMCIQDLFIQLKDSSKMTHEQTTLDETVLPPSSQVLQSVYAPATKGEHDDGLVNEGDLPIGDDLTGEIEENDCHVTDLDDDSVNEENANADHNFNREIGISNAPKPPDSPKNIPRDIVVPRSPIVQPTEMSFEVEINEKGENNGNGTDVCFENEVNSGLSSRSRSSGKKGKEG